MRNFSTRTANQYLILSVVFVSVGLLQPLNLFAQALDASAPSSSAVSSNNSTPGTSSTVSSMIEPSLTQAGGFFSQAQFVTQVPMSTEQDTLTRFIINPGYGFGPSLFVSVTAEFDYLFSKYKDQDRNSAMMDTVVTFGSSRLFEKDGYIGSANFNLTLPTSRVSRLASLIMGYSGEIGIYKKFGFAIASLSNEFYVFQHQYTTSDAQGSDYNERFANWLKGSIVIPLVKKLNFENSGFIYTGFRYSGVNVSTYRISTGLGYQVAPKWVISGRVQLQDRIQTTNPFLDGDTLSALGILTVQL